jgi:hypothetical protein
MQASNHLIPATTDIAPPDRVSPTVHAAIARSITWSVAIVAVGLPQIALDLFGVAPPSWLPVADLALVAGALALSMAWTPMRPLARFFVVLLLLQPAVHAALWPRWLTSWQAALPGGQVLRAEFLLELAVAGAIVAALLFSGLRRRQVFLTAGQIDAPVEPVRWLIDGPTTWARLGPVSAILIGFGTLAFLVAARNPPTADRALSVLPVVLVIAAVNALNEEVIFRAGPVAALGGVLGRRELVFLVVALFAIPHYFGVPFGLVGVAMASVFGWWTTKALLETRGLLWPWVIHLVQDVLIFTFILAGTSA